jgi:hypothetical protein
LFYLRINAVERIILTGAGTKIPVDAAIRKVLGVMSQERAAINERAACTAAMAFTLALGRNALPHVFAMENREVAAPELAQDL